VLALGAEVNFFGTEGAAEHAFPMYTLPDAVRLKEHVLERWEAADKDASLVDDGALNVVVVGGGPTGVETAGAMAELYRNVLSKDYRDLPKSGARITLVEGGPEIFAMFKPDIRAYTIEALEKLTVEVMTGERVASVSPTRVTLGSGAELKAHTLVWGAGLQGNRLVQSLGLDLEPGNRIGVGPELELSDRPEVYSSATSGRSPTRRRSRSSPSSARSRSSRDSTWARPSRSGSRARKPSLSSTTTRAPWPRSVEERRSSRRCTAGRRRARRRSWPGGQSTSPSYRATWTARRRSWTGPAPGSPSALEPNHRQGKRVGPSES